MLGQALPVKITGYRLGYTRVCGSNRRGQVEVVDADDGEVSSASGEISRERALARAAASVHGH